MLIALGIFVILAVLIAAVAIYQYIRPPAGPPVNRHELTPFEAQAAVEQASKTVASGTMTGGGPGGNVSSTGGSSWKKKI